MKRLSWKYMAGLIDGEGCLDMQGSTDKRDGSFYCRPRLRVTLTGSDGHELIANCIENFKGCYDGKVREWAQPHWTPAHTWILSGKTELRKFLQNITNHLILKKEQAKFQIWWLDNIGGKHVTEEVRRLGVSVLKAMKKDPQRLNEKAVQEIIALMLQSR